MTPTISTTNPVVLVKPDCREWKVIPYSVLHDSPQTISRIIVNNSAQRAACAN